MNFQLFSGDRVLLEGSLNIISNSHAGISAGHNLNSNSMPERTYYFIKKQVNKDIIESQDPSDCVVCLEECDKNDSFKLSCDCKYSCHKKCLEKWLKVNNSCPFCKI